MVSSPEVLPGSRGPRRTVSRAQFPGRVQGWPPVEGQPWDHRSPPLGVAGGPGVPEEASVWTSAWCRATSDHTLVGVHVGDGNAPSALVRTPHRLLRRSPLASAPRNTESAPNVKHFKLFRFEFLGRRRKKTPVCFVSPVRWVLCGTVLRSTRNPHMEQNTFKEAETSRRMSPEPVRTGVLEGPCRSPGSSERTPGRRCRVLGKEFVF